MSSNPTNIGNVPLVVNVISQNTPLSKHMLKSIRNSVENIFCGPYIQGITGIEAGNNEEDKQRAPYAKLGLRQMRQLRIEKSAARPEIKVLNE